MLAIVGYSMFLHHFLVQAMRAIDNEALHGAPRFFTEMVIEISAW
jgi:hypothetical protein